MNSPLTKTYKFWSNDGTVNLDGLTFEQAQTLVDADEKKTQNKQVGADYAAAQAGLNQAAQPAPQKPPMTPTPSEDAPPEQFIPQMRQSMASDPNLGPQPKADPHKFSGISHQLAGRLMQYGDNKAAQTAVTDLDKQGTQLDTDAAKTDLESKVQTGVGQFNARFAPGGDYTADDMTEALSNLKANLPESKDHPAIAQLEEKIKAYQAKDKSKTGGMFGSWRAKTAERDAIISGMDPYTKKPITNEQENESAWDMWEKTWATSTNLAITPKYIKGQATRTGATTTASQEAQLAPDIVGGKAGKAAAENSAKQNQTKVDAGMAANALFEPLMRKDGTLDPAKLAPMNVGELFITTAKMLNQTGQLSNEQLETVSQKTFAQDAAKLTQYFGKQFGGATSEQVLANMYHLIQREGMQAQRAVNSARSGKAQTFKVLEPEKKPTAPGTQTKVVNGVTYTKGSDGLWHKQK